MKVKSKAIEKRTVTTKISLNEAETRTLYRLLNTIEWESLPEDVTDFVIDLTSEFEMDGASTEPFEGARIFAPEKWR